MYVSARKAIAEITGLGRPVKKGLAVVLDEFAKVYKEMEAIKAAQTEMNQRQTNQELQNAEILKLVNAINNKLTTTKMEENAAQMGFLKKIAKSRYGWVFILMFCAGLVCVGISLVYFIEHSNQVSQIISTIN